MSIIHIGPYQYVHIKDNTQTIVYLLEGPRTYILESQEELTFGPTNMITIQPNEYITVINPVVRDSKGEAVNEAKFKQAKLEFGSEQVRTGLEWKEPFPLYPGEIDKDGIHTALILSETQAIRLVANWTFDDPITKTTQQAGRKWDLQGPMVYYSQVEATKLEVIEAYIIKPKSALKVSALYDFTDKGNTKRRSGEEWLVRAHGSFLPSVEMEVKGFVYATILTDIKGIKLRAKKNFTDIYKVERKSGQEWLVTNSKSSYHICDVYEEFVKEEVCITLNRFQYCIILDPFDKDLKKNKYGLKVRKTGEDSFFLEPGESLLENKIFVAELLSEEEALLLNAIETYDDEFGTHQPGKRWMVPGPRLYFPDIPVKVMEKRKLIPLDEHEGIYVRDIYSGKVRMVSEKSYMLNAQEELWNKELSLETEMVLNSGNGFYHEEEKKNIKIAARDKFRVVTYTVQHNSAVQVFDFKIKKNRIYFGPQLIMLGPYEEFTVLKLSADTPKKEERVKSLELRLGPDYMNDAIEVETSDHARLYLKLTYSWQFMFDKTNEKEYSQLFNVKDFIGDCCKNIASRVRGAVSAVNFDTFHKESSSIVQKGVFGKDDLGNLKIPLEFPNNPLIVTNVDIQSQEPIDTTTREILNKSMKLSMETNLKIQEQESKHREDRAMQDAKGKIDRKKLEDETANEEHRLNLLILKNKNDEISSTGVSVAEAKARAEENEIKTLTELEKAKKEFEAEKIKVTSDIKLKDDYYKAEVKNAKRFADLAVENCQEISSSQLKKIQTMVEAIGKDTLVELAKAGPDAQVSLMQNLGIKSMIFTDGKNPINLFNTASGLLGGNTL